MRLIYANARILASLDSCVASMRDTEISQLMQRVAIGTDELQKHIDDSKSLLDKDHSEVKKESNPSD